MKDVFEQMILINILLIPLSPFFIYFSAEYLSFEKNCIENINIS